jgi:hypothetical protein
LIGEGQWREAHGLCAALPGGWRLPSREELVRLGQTTVMEIPEEVFGKKQDSYLSVGSNGGPVYVEMSPPIVSYINTASDQKAAVICVR